MDSSSQDRNLPASEQKLKKARDEGQVGRSRDITHLAVLGGGFVFLSVLLPYGFEALQTLLQRQLRFDAQTSRDPATMLLRLGEMAVAGSLICLVVGGLIGAVVVLASIASGGWVFSLKPITPDFSRLNPLKGLANLFSKEKLTETVKMTLLTALLFIIAALYLRSSLQTVASLLLQPSSAALPSLAEWIRAGVFFLLLLLLLATLIDVPLQTFLFKSRLKMSLQEVKEEHKQLEGNPQIKGRMRQRQREIAMNSSINNVPKADFVVMNPTHYAVAIQYDDATMRAPRVISKGTDLLALKIREVATFHAIPVLQSPPLARALYTHAELDQDIPTSLYTAVAQVLAYIYRLKAAMRGNGPMPGEMPQPNVPPELDPLSKVVANRT